MENASSSSLEKAAQSSNTGAPEDIVQDSNYEAASKELTDGEKVYLCLPNNELIFRANYSEDGDIVHGHAIAINQARFFITKVLKNCSKWQNFDSDLHSGGTAILWNLAHTSKQQHTSPSSLQLGTEARKPKVLPDQKRKRNPSKWKKNVKKLKLNQSLRKYRSSVDTNIIPPL